MLGVVSLRNLRLRFSCAAALCGAMASAGAVPALASFHDWRIDQFFSNADATVQYIRFTTTSGGQQFLNGHTLKSSTLGTYTFDHDLPGDTTNRKFIIATQGYVNLPGGVQPDYVSSGPLFSRGGDTINFADVDSVTFTGAQYSTLTAPTAVKRELFAVNVDRSGQSIALKGNFFRIQNFALEVGPTWQNIASPYDVDGDGTVKPLDVLTVIDYMKLIGNGFQFSGQGARTKTEFPFLDADGDYVLKPLDVLTVIDYINARSSPAPLGIISHVPEPSTAALAVSGGIGYWWLRRRRRRLTAS